MMAKLDQIRLRQVFWGKGFAWKIFGHVSFFQFSLIKKKKTALDDCKK